MPTRTKPKSQPTPADLLLYAAEAEECRRSFRAFVKKAWQVLEPSTPLKWTWFHDAICEHLQAVYEGQIHRIVINIAPGHTKSTLVSQIFPMWVWTRNPAYRWLCASTSLDLAIRDNRNSRYLAESEWYRACYGREFHVNQTQFDMSQDQSVKSYFENDHKGYKMAVSVGSKGIGKRGDGLIIDDPHDPMEGDVKRQEVLEWYAQTWTSRLNDMETGAMIIVGQRIHDEDLCGHVLKLGGWEHLCLPEEYEASRKSYTSIGWCDPRDEEGELLWPEKFSNEVLDKLKDGLGSFGYSAQYGQLPVPSAGGIFKQEWARYFEIEGGYYILHTKYGARKPVSIRSCRCEAVCDLAVSEREQADFFVIQTWAITPENECLLLHQLRGHFTNPDQQKKAVELYEQFAWMIFWIENVAYQLAYIQQLRNYELEEEVSPGLYRKRVVSIPVRPWKPFRDKVARAGVAAVKMEAGDLYWLMRAPYLKDLEPEIFKFPKSKKKDQVDCHSMICDVLSNPMIPLSGYVLEADRVTLPTPSTQATTSPQDLTVLRAKLNEYERERGLPLS